MYLNSKYTLISLPTQDYLHISSQLPIFQDFFLLNCAQKIQNSLLLLSEVILLY